MQWQHTHSPSIKIFQILHSALKIMTTIFWDRKGLFLVDLIEQGAMINAGSYCETLKKLCHTLYNKQHEMFIKGVCFYKLISAPIQHEQLRSYWILGWDVLPHPLCSPDLAPSDYRIFTKLKDHVSGMHFSNDEEVKDAVKLGAEGDRRGVQHWYTTNLSQDCKSVQILMEIMSKDSVISTFMYTYFEMKYMHF